MDDRTAGGMRGLISRGYVESVDDDGEEQTMTVTTHDGVTRSGIPVAQFYGLAGKPPIGAQVVLLAVGGDQGDMLALPAFHTGKRMGGFQHGENALYDEAGNRVAIYNGGQIEVVAAVKVRIVVPNCEIIAPAGTRVKGDLDIEGDLRVTGQVSDAKGSMQTMRDQYNAHINPGDGLSHPNPQMD